jgi:hypothetical protein
MRWLSQWFPVIATSNNDCLHTGCTCNKDTVKQRLQTGQHTHNATQHASMLHDALLLVNRPGWKELPS